MLSFISPLLYLFAGTSGASILLKRKFGQVLPFFIMASILFAYVFGLLGALWFGWLILPIIAFGLLLAGVILEFIRLDKTSLKPNSTKIKSLIQNILPKIITPGLIAFALIYIYIYIYNKLS